MVLIFIFIFGRLKIRPVPPGTYGSVQPAACFLFFDSFGTDAIDTYLGTVPEEFLFFRSDATYYYDIIFFLDCQRNGTMLRYQYHRNNRVHTGCSHFLLKHICRIRGKSRTTQ